MSNDDYDHESLQDEGREAGEGEQRAERRGTRRGVLIGIGVVVVAIALIGAGIFLAGTFRSPQPTPDNTVAVTSLPPEAVPPAQTLPVTTPTPPAEETTPQESTVTVAINRWTWVAAQQAFAVGGFADVVEEGGTCTLTAVGPNGTYQASAPATRDVTTTVCVINLLAENAPSGSYQLTLSYDGPSGHGESEAVEVVVP
ncbi:hypothetical protein F8O01_05990 [Pseudoclavibacter chungangensis]|uniref:Uncharacterized protein n=1 Tax=Pseudoclavibacter chungangensis TaxID=587635 RepID=A0A7J5BYP3_9MICO|nr:hypothetical protein [Pseudoclavibacter chungangensis]KAB1659475.1 hypothetical protein F8O01_05990 [Pseudoclavibacter chungangensis]NYJ67668.1 hypothetical protein [Pseudoclavibacter chungangensis]